MTGILFTDLPGGDLEPLPVGDPLSPQSAETCRQQASGRPDRPHGMRTITSFENGWETIRVVGDIRPVDISALRSAALGAFLRRPVRLVIDLSQVSDCDSEGVRWILDTRQRIARCGGELKVVVPTNGPIDHQVDLSRIV